MTNTMIVTAGLLLYLGVLVALTLRRAGVRKASAFMIADRRVGWFATMASVVGNLRDGAGLAAWVVLGLYFGYGALWLTAGLSLGLVILGLLAPHLRALAAERDYFSVTQLLRDSVGPRTESLAAAVIAGTALLYAVAQVHVAGRVFGSLLGIQEALGVMLTVAVVGGYLTIGGYATSVRTGVFQWFVLLVIIVLPWLLRTPGGIPVPASLTSPGWMMAAAFAGISVLVTLSSSDLWQLVFSSRSDRDARWGFWVSVPCYWLISVGMVLFATALGAALGGTVRPEDAFFAMFDMAPAPAWVLSLIGVFVAAAVMSTLDSQVFLIVSTIVGRLRGETATDDPKTEKMSRSLIVFVMLVLGVLGVTVIDLVTFLFSAVTLATVLVPVLLVASFRQRVVTDTAAAVAAGAGVVSYVFLFARGAYDNLPMTLVPAGISTAGLALGWMWAKSRRGVT